MAWQFGDGFDLYAAPADAANGYWDATSASLNSSALANGRFSGSRALAWNTASTLIKTSATNDAVHHFVLGFQQINAISGSSLGFYVELFDGTTAQCTVVFRTDGAILLASGGPTGTVLATYTGAFTASNTWYAFEVEIVINNTTGSFSVRKNGNTVNDFTATSLNTRPTSTNNYANKIQLASSAVTSSNHQVDDFLWRSDASSVPWVGDIRCFSRMPASDVSVAWSRSGSVVPQIPYGQATTPTAVTVNAARYVPFTALCSGSVGSVTVPFTVASTGNFKCSIFTNSAGAVGAVLGSATVVSAPAIGTATFTFGTPVSVTAGTQYWVGFIGDTTSGTWTTVTSNTYGTGGTGVAYAAFPTASPTGNANQLVPYATVNITPTTIANAQFVTEPQQDGANSYVYSSTAGQSDLYGIGASLQPGTPANVVMVTTIGLFEKSDAGTRNAAMQMKSGSATAVQSPSTALTAGTWQWLWRNDLTDPNTGSAWVSSAVDAIQIGPVCTV